jgi:hypothetical protein
MRHLVRQEQCHEVSAQLLPERPALQDVLPVPGPALQEGQTQVAHHQRDAHCRVCLRSQVCGYSSDICKLFLGVLYPDPRCFWVPLGPDPDPVEVKVTKLTFTNWIQLL